MIEDLLGILSERIGMTVTDERRAHVKSDLAREIARQQDEGALPPGEHSALKQRLLKLAGEAPLDHPVMLALVRCITIPESYFFRDGSQFELLASRVLPNLLSERSNDRVLRVLSAGCSSGEELYSMAILLAHLGLPRMGWDCRLLGGDVSAASVGLARAGRYSSWSMRGVRPEIVSRYFRRDGSGFELLTEIRDMASFRVLNLNESLGVGAQDIIFFRNVAIYFAPAVRRRILDNLIATLSEGGYLISGAAELALETLPQMVSVGCSIYRKQRAPAVRPKAPPRPAPAPMPPVSRPRPVVIHPARALSPSPLPLSGSPSAPDLALARKLADRGELAEAERCLTRFLRGRPDDVEARYLLGLAQHSGGRVEEALESFRTAVYFDHAFVVGHLWLGLLHAQTRSYKAARRHFLRVRHLLAEPVPGRLHPSGQTDQQILAVVEEQLSRV